VELTKLRLGPLVEMLVHRTKHGWEAPAGAVEYAELVENAALVEYAGVATQAEHADIVEVAYIPDVELPGLQLGPAVQQLVRTHIHGSEEPARAAEHAGAAEVPDSGRRFLAEEVLVL